jgi:probable HAF family extracellular repeat protein
MHQLAPLKGDTVAFAFGINDRSQAVGGSGVCGNTTPPPYVGSPHAVLWERDSRPIDLGSLGGSFSSASAINSRGDVSGTSGTADGTPHAFLWTPESHTLQMLETPAGFPFAINPCCKTINDRREIVGLMLDINFNSHAFLWKDGVMVDLNDLIPKTSSWVLQSAAGINESGQIAGQGLINGEVHAFLATPSHRHDGGGECCDNHGH